MNRLRRPEAHAAESEVENNQQVWEGEKKGNGERRRPPSLSLCVCTATGRAHVESGGGDPALSQWERRQGEGGRKGGRIARERESFAPLRANDGLSLTSAAADGRRGPSAHVCLVFFHLCLHLLLFSPVLLPRRLGRLIGCPTVPDVLREKCRLLRHRCSTCAR